MENAQPAHSDLIGDVVTRGTFMRRVASRRRMVSPRSGCDGVDVARLMKDVDEIGRDAVELGF